jgi:hypothetical protein
LFDNLLEGHSSIIIIDFDKFSHLLVTFKYDGIVYFFDPQLSSYGKNEQRRPAIFRCDEIMNNYFSPINFFHTLQLNPNIKVFEDKLLHVEKCNLPIFAKGRKTKKANKRKTRKPKKSNKTKQNKK